MRHPHAEPCRSILEKARVCVIDLTAINAEDVTEHGKFAQSEVVKAIGQRLANGQTLTEATLTLGDESAVSRKARPAHSARRCRLTAPSGTPSLAGPSTTFRAQITNLGTRVGFKLRRRLCHGL